MAGRSQCDHCAAALGFGANYCSQCGTPQPLLVLDPLSLEDPPAIRGRDTAPHARLSMLAGLVVVFAMLAVLWGLSREGDPADEEPLSSETPEVGILAADPTTSTAIATTTASTTAGALTTASEQLFVNDVQGPVLGDGVDGVLVQIDASTMEQIDLSTGAIERIALEHPVYSAEAESSLVVNGKLVVATRTLHIVPGTLRTWNTVITITDLSDGSQREPRDITESSFEMHVAGRADVDSIWLATYPEPDGVSEAVEVGLDGEVRRRVEIPQPFEIRWAEGDELILGSPDGSWRYDTLTGATVRMPGVVVAFGPGLVFTSSCDESLQCDVFVDRGGDPEVVDWLSAGEILNGSMEVSPDMSGALVHVDGDEDLEFSYIDLRTGSRVDLGNLPIDPYLGVVWVEGSRWIIGFRDTSPRAILAIDTATGTQVDLRSPPNGIRAPQPSPTTGSFLAFTPSN